MKIPTLFISYDGLLDPLGGSQILPYVRGIASHPRYIHVLSFEKQERYATDGAEMHRRLSDEGIGWTPLPFTTKLGKLGKLKDLVRMYLTAFHLQFKHGFGVLHCRSYQAAQVGVFVKRLFRSRMIFDMRGLWADDRVEGGLWPQDKLLYRALYKYYKRLENKMLNTADAVVVLTNRVIPEILRLSQCSDLKIHVIPCCADFEHFSSAFGANTRHELGFNDDSIVISYLGSLGTVYLFEDMLEFFKKISASREEDVHLLLITKDWSAQHERLILKMGMENLRPMIHIRPASRDEVPSVLAASNLMLSFRRSSYSQQACSPTKIAEALALGIPVISNSGVGDVDEITRNLDAGALIDLADESAVDLLANNLDDVISKGGENLRERAMTKLDLKVANTLYMSVYREIDGLNSTV